MEEGHAEEMASGELKQRDSFPRKVDKMRSSKVSARREYVSPKSDNYPSAPVGVACFQDILHTCVGQKQVLSQGH